MTICVAALFQWNYGNPHYPDHAGAAILLTDRMITAGDVQYEPQQTKVADITPRVVLSIAGDYSVHSQAIRKTMHHFQANQDASPEQVAIFYGRAVQAIKLKEAEDLYLAPLGMNSDSFLAQQKDMSAQFVSLLTDQMQGHRGDDVEAIVVGSHNGIVEMWGVDTKGVLSCFNDVGFAAIGSGVWHAKSRLMQAGFTNQGRFAAALSYSFAAKKSAELAPGVGTNTDIVLVFRDKIERLPQNLATKLNELYIEYRQRSVDLMFDIVGQLQTFISKPVLQDANETSKGLPGGNAQVDERPSPPAAETARPNEAGPGGGD